MNLRRNLSVALFSCLLLATEAACAADLGPTIRIALVAKQFSAEVSSAGGIQVVSSGRSPKLNAGKHIISTKGGKLFIDNKDAGSTSITLKCADSKKPLAVNHKEYRGTVKVQLAADRKTLDVVNLVQLEEYLYGVLPKEIIPLWPEQAVKAQAVASRSFALYQKQNTRNQSYDIRANEMGQVYGGLSVENSRTNKIVDATRGEVATYGGRPIEAFFHSCSGGYTESAENVWGRDIPYLQGVADYDYEAPKFVWEKTFTPAQMERLLSQAGYNIGKLDSIKLSPMPEKLPLHTSKDRGISGRVKNVFIKGKRGSVTIAGTKLRSILQLDSTKFDIDVGFQKPEYIEVPIENKAGFVIGKKQIPIRVKDGDKQLGYNSEVDLISGVEGEKIFIRGGGWGHGIGLSQWGARGMALQDKSKSKRLYIDILKHYYRGISVSKFY